MRTLLQPAAKSDTSRRMNWIAVLLFIVVPSAFGQFLDQGGLTGTVQDTTGAVIPGARVTLLDTDTALKLVGKTDRSGVYIFSPIAIGHYSVTVTAPGFEQTTQQSITVDMGQTSP